MGENVAGTGIRTHNLLTWTIWRWVSAILTAFSHLSVCQGLRTSSHYHLGDLGAAGNQTELLRTTQIVYIQPRLRAFTATLQASATRPQ